MHLPSCKVRDEIVEVESAEAAAVSITSHPKDIEASVGETVEYKVVASGEGLTYQWQFSAANGKWWLSTTTIPGYNTDTLKVKALEERFGYLFRCIVTDANGNSVTSDAAKLTEAPLKITVQPVDAEASKDETVEYKVVASGEGLTYQWQFSAANGEWWLSTTTIPGYNTDTLKVKALEERFGYLFRCIVTDANGNSVTSDAAQLIELKEFVVDDVLYEVLDNRTLRVVGYTGSADTLIINETVNGMTVTEIGEEAFMNNVELVSIDLPDTIIIIRARAFKGCTKLSVMK